MSIIKNRVVVLVDMDCFYVQVVQRKNPSLLGKPCAVVQYQKWRGGGIIAVGYEARKYGVTRQMRGDDAKQKCPDIALVHVPENRGKADLTQFREAGAEVIQVLSTFSDELERASIDEAYIDLTQAIEKNKSKYTLEEVALKTFMHTHLVGLDNKDINFENEDELQNSDLFKQWMYNLESNEHNFNLAVGAIISNEMRTAVKEQTGFSCSAGIGTNKMLAKIVAGFHKPNQQTLVLQEHVHEMFKSTKMRKIRNLGGKLGQQLEDKFKVEFMDDLSSLSLKQLQDVIGTKSGELVYWLCRGVDHEPVRVRQLTKSVGCSKNFTGKLMLKTKTDVRKWLANLSEEVVERLEKEKEQNNRIATLFTVGCTNECRITQSRRCTLLKTTHQQLTDESFKTLLEFNTSTSGDDWSPGIINLSLNASKFQELNTVPMNNINRYMRNAHPATTSTAIRSAPPVHSDEVSKSVSSPRQSNSNKQSIENFFQLAFKRNALQQKNNSFDKTSEISRAEVSGAKTLTSSRTENSDQSNTLSVSPRIITPEKNSTKRKFQIIDENPLEKVYSKKSFFSPTETFFHKQSNLNNTKTLPENRFSTTGTADCNSLTSKKSADELLNDFGFFNKAPNLSCIDEQIENLSEKDHSQNKLNLDQYTNEGSSSSDNANLESVSDVMNCTECGKEVLAWDLPEHLDYHYAKELQTSFRNDFLNLYNRTKTNSEPQKKRSKTQMTFKNYFSSQQLK